MSSIESAITSRLTSEAFIPWVPIVTPSETATVLNSIGVPPAARTPSLTCSASPRRWKLQGIASVQVLAMPIVGLLSASSSKTTLERGRGRLVVAAPFELMDRNLLWRSRDQIEDIDRAGSLTDVTQPVR